MVRGVRLGIGMKGRFDDDDAVSQLWDARRWTYL